MLTKEQVLQFQEFSRRATIGLGKIAITANRFLEHMAPALEELARFAPHIEALQKDSEGRQFCDKNGIDPHKVISLMAAGVKTEEQFWNEFDSNWKYFRRELLNSFEHSIEPSRKAVFNELLKAFSRKCYTVVTRSAIIELEGIASDFCSKHSVDDENNRKNFVAKAPDVAGVMTAVEIGGFAVFEALDKYSQEIYASTKRHQYAAIQPVDPAVSRHFQAHGTHRIHSQKEAFNAIALMHHYATFSSASDKSNSTKTPA